ncbi:hypothetical protein R1sor_025377 [Riccia sorocarpa]|uniref:Plant basic secretory protein n=1 Tax=Riccia sorocarpa TaxID=122646 RepID=A0ABD3GCD6_9MARC
MGIQSFFKLNRLTIPTAEPFCIGNVALAINFSVDNAALNTPGGQRFDKELGNDAMIGVLQNAQAFIENAFSMAPTKNIAQVTLHVESFDGVAFSYFGGDIHLSSDYVENNNPGNSQALKTEITGVLYHEETHVLQNSNGAPSGVIEGVADFIRLRAGYAVWERRQGGKWDDGYSTTAFFFDWIDSTQTDDFVNKLNQKLGITPWNVNFFVDLTGKDVDTLWQEYQNSI